jgi:hypothetical protein
MATLTITTVPAATVPAGKVQITARTRAMKDKETGKAKEIPADQRSRSVLIDELTPAVSKKYLNIVCAALYETAKQQLDALWVANPLVREMDSALMTEDALLAYAARESESKKLTGEAIVLWWNQSELKKELSKKATDAQLARLVGELKNIAAPTPDYNEEKALKRIATLGTCESDTEHDVCAAMISKLQRIIDKIRAEREAIGSTEELDF